MGGLISTSIQERDQVGDTAIGARGLQGRREPDDCDVALMQLLR